MNPPAPIEERPLPAAASHEVRTWPAKRAFDLIIALGLAVITAPLVILLAVVSALSFRAWPFFCQERVGRDGSLFRFVKVRSLPPSSPKYADKYVIGEVRNTRWGRFIRRSHLDEVPQVWLVVFGKMSLVGPRPEMRQLADTFDPDFVTMRTRVRPGITGLWQISVAQEGLIGEAPEYDELYVRESSLRLDLWILWRTVRDVLSSDAAIRVDDVPRFGIQGARRSEAITAAMGSGLFVLVSDTDGERAQRLPTSTATSSLGSNPAELEPITSYVNVTGSAEQAWDEGVQPERTWLSGEAS